MRSEAADDVSRPLTAKAYRIRATVSIRHAPTAAAGCSYWRRQCSQRLDNSNLSWWRLNVASQVPPKGKNFLLKGRGVALLVTVIVFSMKTHSLNCTNASTMASGVKNPPKRMWCRSRDRCLNFNPFNISGGMSWGR